MKKSDIAVHVASRASLSKAEAGSAVEAVFNTMRDALANGDTVAVPGSARSGRRAGRRVWDGTLGRARASQSPRRKHRCSRLGRRFGIGCVRGYAAAGLALWEPFASVGRFRR